MNKRANKVEKDRRILAVQGWIIDGVQDNLIIRQIVQKWEVSRRQAERYLKTAHTNWKKQEDVDIEEERAAAIARLQHIARGMDPVFKKTPQGVNSLLGVERQLHRLKDLKPPKRIEHTVKPVSEMTDEEREQRIEELIRIYNSKK